MKKKIFFVLACVFLLAGCNNVKLTNGENAVVTFTEGGISSDELYNSLKESYGAERLMNLIDSKLLNEKYETSTEEKSYINQTVKTTNTTIKTKTVKYHQKKGSGNSSKCPVCGKFMKKG